MLLKVEVFQSIFSLNLSLNKKTVLNSITPSKSHCRPTFYTLKTYFMFFQYKKFDNGRNTFQLFKDFPNFFANSPVQRN